nr:hypothetical protein [Verrucomicrobiota bacterium]
MKSLIADLARRKRAVVRTVFLLVGICAVSSGYAQSPPPLPPLPLVGEPVPGPDGFPPLPGLGGGEPAPVESPPLLPPLPGVLEPVDISPEAVDPLPLIDAGGPGVFPLGLIPSEPSTLPETELPPPLADGSNLSEPGKPDPVEVSGFSLPPVTDNAGLLRLLDEVRIRLRREDYQGAQALTEQTLRTYAETAENAFYLRQFRREQTNLYYRMAHKALKEKRYSLASQYLGHYQENVARDAEDRKRAREVRVGTQGKSDVSLVGKLVEELDEAKKELAEIRAKSGLPESDAKVDYERIMAQEQQELVKAKSRAERLLKKARIDSADGQYELAKDQVDEALSFLPKNVATIALISDLYKAKQQILWYRIGEAMQKGRVGNVQILVLEYQDVEKERRSEEVATLGIEEGPDFEGEMKKAREKAEQQAKLAERRLATTILALRGKVNFRNLSRYSALSARTYARQFDQPFDFIDLNRALIDQVLPADRPRLLAFDPCFIPKAGKHTPDLASFWHGSHGRAEKGLEVSAFSIVDLEHHTGYALSVQQSPAPVEGRAEDETLIDAYLEHLHTIVPYL